MTRAFRSSLPVPLFFVVVVSLGAPARATDTSPVMGVDVPLGHTVDVPAAPATSGAPMASAGPSASVAPGGGAKTTTTAATARVDATQVVDQAAMVAALAQHYGLSVVLGALPAAGAALLFAMPYGVLAAPLVVVAPLIGTVLAAGVTNVLGQRKGGYAAAALGALLAGVPVYLALGLTAAAPVVDDLAHGASFKPSQPLVTLPGAGVLAGAAFVAAATTSVFGTLMYVTSSARE